MWGDIWDLFLGFRNNLPDKGRHDSDGLNKEIRINHTLQD